MKVIQILVHEARVGFNTNAPHIVNYTNGWCSGPVVCVNTQMPPGVIPCDLELLAHLLTAPTTVINLLKGNLTPTEIQLNSLRANRQAINYIDQLFV